MIMMVYLFYFLQMRSIIPNKNVLDTATIKVITPSDARVLLSEFSCMSPNGVGFPCSSKRGCGFTISINPITRMKRSDA